MRVVASTAEDKIITTNPEQLLRIKKGLSLEDKNNLQFSAGRKIEPRQQKNRDPQIKSPENKVNNSSQTLEEPNTQTKKPKSIALE